MVVKVFTTTLDLRFLKGGREQKQKSKACLLLNIQWLQPLACT